MSQRESLAPQPRCIHCSKQLGDLYDLISHDKIPGIPRDPDTLADILIERGFAVPNTVQEKGERAYYRYWEVLPEMLQRRRDR